MKCHAGISSLCGCERIYNKVDSDSSALHKFPATLEKNSSLNFGNNVVVASKYFTFTHKLKEGRFTSKIKMKNFRNGQHQTSMKKKQLFQMKNKASLRARLTSLNG